jgi:hypothetical protein
LTARGSICLVRIMIRLAISSAAFDAVAGTLLSRCA